MFEHFSLSCCDTQCDFGKLKYHHTWKVWTLHEHFDTRVSPFAELSPWRFRLAQICACRFGFVKSAWRFLLCGFISTNSTRAQQKRKRHIRPNPHRTQDVTRNATQANGTWWCEWGCPHCTQATSKEKCLNLRMRPASCVDWASLSIHMQRQETCQPMARTMCGLFFRASAHYLWFLRMYL